MSIGLKLAKFTQSCPLVVYTYILSQVEAFDNLIPFAVEALKYCSDLSRDAMAFCLVSQLRAKGSDKLKEGDTHYSQWFGSLSKFIAVFYGRYPMTELKGLLHYLLRSFSEGQSLDLLVLKDLLVIMGGCETLLDVSQMQLEGLSAGKALRSEVMMMGVSAQGLRRHYVLLQ
jgi:THO complex subunit 2